MARLTIYDIKRATSGTSPYFFSRNTLKFFGQTLKSFSVKKINERFYRISSPSYDYRGKYMGETARVFDSQTNELLSEDRYKEQA